MPAFLPFQGQEAVIRGVEGVVRPTGLEPVALSFEG